MSVSVVVRVIPGARGVLVFWNGRFRNSTAVLRELIGKKGYNSLIQSGIPFRDAANPSWAIHVHSYARRDLTYRLFPIEAQSTRHQISQSSSPNRDSYSASLRRPLIYILAPVRKATYGQRQPCVRT